MSTEQQVEAYRSVHERELGIEVPATGTLLVDYPVIVTARGERHDAAAAAATALTDALHTSEGSTGWPVTASGAEADGPCPTTAVWARCRCSNSTTRPSPRKR